MIYLKPFARKFSTKLFRHKLKCSMNVWFLIEVFQYTRLKVVLAVHQHLLLHFQKSVPTFFVPELQIYPGVFKVRIAQQHRLSILSPAEKPKPPLLFQNSSTTQIQWLPMPILIFRAQEVVQ